MKVTSARTDKRVDYRKEYGIIMSWGAGNDYPQKLMEIVAASASGRRAVMTRGKFVAGIGFTEQTRNTIASVAKNETFADLGAGIERDYCLFDGFAIHVNFNLLFEPVEWSFVPLETLRLGLPDENNCITCVYQHPDWGKRNTAIRSFQVLDAVKYDLYTGDIDEFYTAIENAGGIENYNGQIFLFSNAGKKLYPQPLIDPVATDMNTEDGVATIKNRNVKNNFLPSSILWMKKTTIPGQSGESEDNKQRDGSSDETAQQLINWQGDQNAAKIAIIEGDFNDDKPEVLDLQLQNFDEAFKYTEESIKKNIREMMLIPPILLGVDAATGFATAPMQDAYNYYNTITQSDREIITQQLTFITGGKFDFTITPLKYPITL